MLTRNHMLVHRLLKRSQQPFHTVVIAGPVRAGATHALKPLAQRAEHADRLVTVEAAPEVLLTSC
ncbi:hypothetical protein [Azohydromonas lata]|uniref:hypothetical protein n=1 Tax=Azohydromonas lata TaxID=45677 RepID=UPI0012F4B688|nr:hypothetical protein [Azohydromonas lata]